MIQKKIIVRQFKINIRKFEYFIEYITRIWQFRLPFWSILICISDKDSDDYFDLAKCSSNNSESIIYFCSSNSEREMCVCLWLHITFVCVCVCIFSCVCVYSVCNMSGLLSIFVIIIIRANWNVRNLLYVKIAVCLNVFISHFDGSDL